MRIEVSFWGVAKRLAGAELRVFELREGADVESLLAQLDGDTALGAELDRCAFAIGTTLVPRSHVLRDGDEVAVLPPVSGG